MGIEAEPLFVVNPQSGGGRGRLVGNRLAELARRRWPGARVVWTEQSGQGRALATAGAREGRSPIVAVGGDGTFSEVASGLLDLDAAARPPLGVIPGGRGSDFARGLGIPKDIDAAFAVLDRPAASCDAGRIAIDGHAGWFLNIADAGLGGYVVRWMDTVRLPIGATPAYLSASLAGLLIFRGLRLSVTDDSGTSEARYLALVVANGRYFGSGMHIAPHADLSDGLLDIVKIEARSLPRLLCLVPRLYSGSLEGRTGVSVGRSRRVQITSGDEILLDVDGERRQGRSVTFEVVPAALRLHRP